MRDGMQPAVRPYRVVGRYRIYSELASGGMATVHLGCLLGTAGFSKLVAIKCLHEELGVESELVSMFLDEARLASSINHPNVVASLDVVAEQGELLVVMEYVHGETLANLLRSSSQLNETPPLPVVARVVCDALEGLHAAHVASLAGTCLNIVHRDVSPQNIMVGADGNTRVLDFGIAQAALRSQVTAAGTIKGKLAYMSPEQARGEAVDARTDVFAAGVVLWEALTGRRLFFAPDARERMALLLTSEIPPPSTIVHTLPSGLDRVVLTALERDRNARYRTAHELAEALRRAIGEGSRGQVAEWVGRLAKDSLARRLEQLQALEASAIHTQTKLPLPVVTGSSPRAAAAPVPSIEHTPTIATAPTTLAAIPTRRRSWRRRAPWVFAATGALAALVAFQVWKANRHSHAPTVTSAEPIAAVSPVPHLLAVSAPTTRTEPRDAVTKLPELSTDPPPSVPPRAATPKPREKKLAGAPPAPSRARPKSCNPPYRIDATGVRRIKPECL